MSFLLFTLTFEFLVAVHYATSSFNQELITGSNGFGFDLTDELYTDPSTNIWISPFCIASCFALIYPGSDGNTQTEIAQVFGYPSTTDVVPSDATQGFLALQSSIQSTYSGVYQISEWYDSFNDVTHSEIQRIASVVGIANKIYSASDVPLKQTYIDALSYQNEAFIEPNFDFTSENAKAIINGWVAENTNDLIDTIIDEATDISDWKLAALNAIYLNGTFASPFTESMTSSAQFYSDESRANPVANIHLMHQIDDFDYYNNGEYQFLKFEFDDWDADLFVLFVLPIDDDLYSQNHALITDSDVIDNALTNLQSTRIALALPKISMEAKYELNEDLKQLGILDAFDPLRADFSEMSDVPLMIDTVIHKTMIEMDEKGLVAAAVTLIGMVRTSVKIEPDPILFKADHPFQMFIIDGAHENNILFMGQVNDPGVMEGSDTPIYDESGDDIWNDYDSYRSEIPISEEPTTTEIEDTSTTEESQETGPQNAAFVVCCRQCRVAVFVAIMSLFQQL